MHCIKVFCVCFRLIFGWTLVSGHELNGNNVRVSKAHVAVVSWQRYISEYFLKYKAVSEIHLKTMYLVLTFFCNESRVYNIAWNVNRYWILQKNCFLFSIDCRVVDRICVLQLLLYNLIVKMFILYLRKLSNLKCYVQQIIKSNCTCIRVSQRFHLLRELKLDYIYDCVQVESHAQHTIRFSIYLASEFMKLNLLIFK